VTQAAVAESQAAAPATPAELQWVPVLREAALEPGRAVRAWARETRVVVGRSGGTLFAALDVCPHLDLPLAAFGPVKMEVKGGAERLVCPWHLWAFDVRTGRCEYASLYADDEMFFFQLEGKERPQGDGAAGYLHVLPARVRDGQVEVAI
jgi:nitrite reductase (NADH) small subunit